ncbi:uncharacterized protein LOC118183782 [Stegodyphus dumicola]|uniref:uncharacterized protein LOC118183782 n=1 Tax=Stegodyphus dumicola TaxID=202533 RepID=UPI0015A8CB7B|nr:uncharacterized protein LOC118183782 [Stegodyphus dumicola]
MVSHRWNLKGNLLKSLYIRAIERMILYGCPIWYTGTERVKTKLNQIQRIALLCITKAYTTSPTAGLQILAGTIPLDIKADMEAQFYRAVHFKENISMGDTTIWNNEIEDRLPTIQYHPAEAKRIEWGKDPPMNKDIEIFTDGSKMNNKVGAAWVAFQDSQEIHNERTRLNNDATVFQAEVHALRSALLWAGQNASSSNRVAFFTDSLSTLHSLNSGKISKRSIQSLREIINTLISTHKCPSIGSKPTKGRWVMKERIKRLRTRRTKK